MTKKKAQITRTKNRNLANEYVKLAKFYSSTFDVGAAADSMVDIFLNSDGIHLSDANIFADALNALPDKTHHPQRTILLLGFFLCCGEKVLDSIIKSSKGEVKDPF